MPPWIVSAAMLALATCSGTPPPATAPALDLPIVLTEPGWRALESADPLGADQVDRVNAAWLCGYEPGRLTAEQAAAICGGAR